MPCTCDGPPSYNSYKPELDEVTELLCELCKELEDEGIFKKFASVALRRWWEKHKKMDAERLERERKEAAEKKAKEDALAKLTPEERKLPTDEDGIRLSVNEMQGWLRILNEHALRFLQEAVEGKILLEPLELPEDVFAGDVTYLARNNGSNDSEFAGGKIVVFNDCNDFDYLDRFEFPDTSVLDFDSMCWELMNYRPETYDDLVGVWSFPAYR